MFKIIKYLKKSIISIILIIGLLVLQAICDLSLPDYTSRIINVGVQQCGIENTVPDVIGKSKLQEILLFMDNDNKDIVINSYSLISKSNSSEKLLKKYSLLEKEDLYILDKVSTSKLEELASILEKPILVDYMLTSDTKENIKTQNSIKSNMPAIYKDYSVIEIISNMPDQQKEVMLTEINKQFDSMPESIIKQGAISAIKIEYNRVGVNTNSMQTNYVIVAGLKMLGVALLSMATTVLVGLLGAKAAAKLAMNLRSDIFKKTLSFGTTEFKQYGVSSLITRTTNDVQQVQQVMVFSLRILFYAPIIGVGGVIKAMAANSTMAWIIGVAVLTVMSFMGLMFALVMPKFKIVQKLIDRLNQVTREILTGIPVIRAFSNQEKEKKRFDLANKNLKKTILFIGRSMSSMMPVLTLIMNAISILIVWKASHSVNDGLMQVGDMLAFIQYTMQIIISFLMVAMFSIMFPRANVSAKRIADVLNTEPAVKDPINPKTFTKRIKGLVEFKDVSFKYPDSDEDVLTDITFTAEPGKTTAFIGSTGSGKSTLINLIPRLFDVTSGEILIDGIDVKDVLLEDLHKKIGFVPQKGVLFSGTILSNINYGNSNGSMEDAEKAARIAQASNFISEKEEKYLSPISQGGTNVSGGQKQRLSIARAVASNPEIYIFDDSFSALDFKTDVELRKALNTEIKDSTVLIVAQRISTILQADQIIVLNEGKIVGKGTHKELLNTCSVYREIANSQLTKEELENE